MRGRRGRNKRVGGNRVSVHDKVEESTRCRGELFLIEFSEGRETYLRNGLTRFYTVV